MISRFSLLVVSVFLFVYSGWVYNSFTRPEFPYIGFSYSGEISHYYFLKFIILIFFLQLCISREIKLAHLFVFVVFIFVFNGILTVGVYSISPDLFESTLAMTVLGLAIIALMSNFSVPLNVRGSVQFEAVLASLFIVASGIICAEALQHDLRLVSFARIYEFRSELSLSMPGRYALSFYVFAIGPAAIAAGMWRKSYVLVAASVGVYVLGYAMTFQKAVLLAPVWVIAVWFFLGVRITRTPVGIFSFLIVPLVIAGVYLSLGLPYSRDVLSLIPMRMYAIPGQVFANYVDFFSRNPHTWFSHVNGVSLFIDYPYAKQLPMLIGEAYPGGNQNANFWAQDAVAGAGMWAIPVVSLAFGLVLVLVNSAAKGLDMRFALTMCTMTAQRFSDGTLATGMLTGGLGLILIFLVLAPRNIYGYEWQRAGVPEEPGLMANKRLV